MKYLVSYDFLDTVPINFNKIVEMAFDAKTSNHYASYLTCVLRRAKKMSEVTGGTTDNIEFSIHQNGCIVPFGEGGHPYCENFYSWINEKELPPFPEQFPKAR